MQLRTNNHRAVAGNGDLILLARIVDSAGAAVHPTDVHRVDYSIYELDPLWPNLATVVAGHHAVELDIGEIMFEALQIGEPWTVDCVGYNFRHDIRGGQHRVFLNAGMEYEIRYRFTSTLGQAIILRFGVKGGGNSRC
jgi:hypothetical protein